MSRFFADHAGFFFRVTSLAIVLISLSLFTFWAQRANANDAYVKEQIMQAQRATQHGTYATDGVFQGEAEGFGGPVRVEVEVEDGYIARASLVSAEYEDKAWLDMALPLLDAIVAEQTTQLDVVSGATFSSSGILNAVTRALMESGIAGE